jgi:pSer/pThr/pTyr-binding forkhead associated (FHA) protein
LREGANQVGAKSAGEGIFPDIDLSSVDTQQVVSRRHAILRVEGDRVTLSDCGSTNGTRVDETKIGTAAVPIFESSNIVFGNLRARLVRR